MSFKKLFLASFTGCLAAYIAWNVLFVSIVTPLTTYCDFHAGNRICALTASPAVED